MNLFGLKPAAIPAPPNPVVTPPTLSGANFGRDLTTLIDQSVVPIPAPLPVTLTPPLLPPAPPAPPTPPLAPGFQPPARLVPAAPIALVAPAVILNPSVVIAPPVIGGSLGTVSPPEIIITPDHELVNSLNLPATPAPHASATHINAVGQIAGRIRSSLSQTSSTERQALNQDALSLDAELNSLEQQEIELHQMLSHLDKLKDTLHERRGGIAERIHKMETMDQSVLDELRSLESY